MLLPVLLLTGLLVPPGDPASADPETLVPVAVEALLGMQEGDGPAEWPYEGVYRVKGDIPIGYRVGGTSLVALALLQAPGWEDEPTRREYDQMLAAKVCHVRPGHFRDTSETPP